MRFWPQGGKNVFEVDKDQLKGKTTVRELFETASEFERTAHVFYADLKDKVSKNIRYLVGELAEEELEHMRIFAQLAKHPDVVEIMAVEIDRPVADREFSDCVLLPDLGNIPNDQDVLQYAIMREDAARRQYAELAETAPGGPLKSAFIVLADEETKHKKELEKIYDDLVHSGSV